MRDPRMMDQVAPHRDRGFRRGGGPSFILEGEPQFSGEVDDFDDDFQPGSSSNGSLGQAIYVRSRLGFSVATPGTSTHNPGT